MSRALILLLMVAVTFWGRPCDAAQKADILRDEYGIPHIFADTQEAAFYAMGWAEAEDDPSWLIFDIFSSQGRMAEFMHTTATPIDTVLVDEDIRARALGYYDLAEGWTRLPADIQMALCAYAAGFNNAVAKMDGDGRLDALKGSSGFDHTALVREFGPITPRDLVALGLRYNAENVLMNMSVDEWDTKTSQARKPGSASNALALAPSGTDLGAAVVYNDLHNRWAQTQRMAHIQIGKDTIFGQFNGPFMIAGRIGHAALAFTRNSIDGADIFEEKINPEDPDYYLSGDRWIPFEKKFVTVKVKHHKDMRKTIYYSRNGWVWDFPTTDSNPVAGHALRIAVLDVSQGQDVPLQFIVERIRSMRMESVQDYLSLLHEPHASSRQIILADEQGNIASAWIGRTPVRKESSLAGKAFDYSTPLPGWTRDNLWENKFWTLDDPEHLLPLVVNPPEGNVRSANDAPWNTAVCQGTPVRPDGLPATVIGKTTNTTPRGLLLRDLLCTRSVRTIQDLHDKLAFNTFCPTARNFIDALERGWQAHAADLETIPLSDDGRVLDRILRAWNAHADVQESGMSVMFHVRRNMTRPWFLPGETPSLDDMREYINALEASARFMNATYGGLDVPWGQIHFMLLGERVIPLPGGTINIPALLITSMGSWYTKKTGERDTIYGDEPFQSNPALKGYIICEFGSSFIHAHIMDPDHPVTFAVTPLGQFSFNTHPNSKHLYQQAELLAAKEWIRVPLSREDVEAHLCPWVDEPGHEHAAITSLPFDPASALAAFGASSQ